jgi:two-component system, NarL family, response regulator LiaR
MELLRIVLVDDYRMVTEALAARLAAAPDLWVAGCSQTDDPRLPEVIRWLRPDLVLIDVEPLGFAIAEVLGRIREAWPAAHIIVVSADEDPAHAVAAARAGAVAWVSKNQSADQLETVLRGVVRGHAWFPPQLLGEILRGLRDDVKSAQESSSLLDSLSPRELDVLTSMAKGKRARQIAAELTISADTVRTHTRSIFGKLEVHSRIEAVSVAWAAGLRPGEAAAGLGAPSTGAEAGAGAETWLGGAPGAGAGPGAPRLPAGRRPAGGPPDRHAGDQSAADRRPEGGQRPTRRADPVRVGPGRAQPVPAQSAGSRPADRGPGGSRAGDSGTTDSGTGDSGTGDSGTGDSGTGDSGTGESGTSNAGPRDSQVGRPTPGQADDS